MVKNRRDASPTLMHESYALSILKTWRETEEGAPLFRNFTDKTKSSDERTIKRRGNCRLVSSGARLGGLHHPELKCSHLVIMKTVKTLICLAFVAATPFATNSELKPLQEQKASIDNDKSISVEDTQIFDELHVQKKNYKVCITEDCKKVAEDILGSMNKTIDPCHDFYEFACGGWAAYKPIPSDSIGSSRQSVYKNVLDQRVRELLESEAETSEILPVVQAKRLYRSCMDAESIERRGIEPIISIVKQAGGWPLSMNETDWDSGRFTWQNVDGHYSRLMGRNAFYDVIVTSTHYTGEIGIGPSELFIARSHLMIDINAVASLVQKVANSFANYSGAVVSNETLTKDAWDLVEFENATFELISQKQTVDWHPADMTVGEFVEWYRSNMTDFNQDPVSRIDWNSTLQDLFDTVNITVRPETKIYIRNMGYFKRIGEILERTPSRTIVNYVHWNFIVTMLSHTTEDMRDEVFKATRPYLEFGVSKRSPRWQTCVDTMKIKYAAAYLFTKKYFPYSTEAEALDMIINIHAGMKDNVEESNWLDVQSKALIREKLNSMKFIMGFPTWYKNETAIVNYYKGLSIDDQYFENVLRYMSFERKLNLKRYVMTFRDNYMIHDPITLNADYSPVRNALNLPPANFQPPLFTPGLPNNVNYGIVGFFVGHEIAHGLDNEGMQRGRYGRGRLLSNETMKRFKERTDCFVNQFNRYYGETETSGTEGSGQESRGARTQAENIADTTGLQAVFTAYKDLKGSSNETRLFGLEEFTDEQLFFISFSSLWCLGLPPVFDKEMVRNRHSSWRLRVIGALSNSDDFAKAFNCPLGSPMNPIEKCNIWKEIDPAVRLTRLRRTLAPTTSLIEVVSDWFQKLLSHCHGPELHMTCPDNYK